MRPKGTPEELEARRRKAVELLQKGLGIREIARQFGVYPGSVLRWKQAIEKGGIEVLKARPHPHRPCRLSPAQKQELLGLLLKGATAFGYPNQLWTLPRVAKVIEERFGITYHPAHVWRILHSCGWSCQKPERRARERDEAEIQRWRHQVWPHIKKRKKAGKNDHLH